MSAPEEAPYIGRFAPSPTGPLHFGSLMAAVASYLDARCNDGRWLVRIEDIDPPREQAGADSDILRMLEAYRFEWDGPVIYQSTSADEHLAALKELDRAGLTYRCNCSRRDLADAPQSSLGAIYPGTCRSRDVVGEAAVRVRTGNESITFEDRLQGLVQHRLESESGDFIVLRRDGLIAYQLAVVVDDRLQGVTHIVRGIDLMDSTPRQIYLQGCLDAPVPSYAHIPVAQHSDGAKLSKATGAAPITAENAGPTLVAALSALQQRPPDDLSASGLDGIWSWAQENWSIARLVGLQNIAVQHYC